jgi:general secretion pathway protein A
VQSFLVGQPELRLTLRSSSMEQLRQRVIASCHLGALTEPETRGYVEHRLRHVGWQGMPAIDEEAFSKLHAHSGGIPRRLNLLCTRALLACSLREGRDITGPNIVQAAEELANEIGLGDVSEVDRLMVRLSKAP